MQGFAALYAELDATTATSAKLAALERYFRHAPPEDAAWALYFLQGGRLKRLVAPTRLRDWVRELTGLSAALVDESHAQVGDLAETVALLIDTRFGPRRDDRSGPALADCVRELQQLAGADEATQRAAVFAAWQRLPFAQGFLYTKLLTGALRVGVAQGLVARALAAVAGVDSAIVQHRLMGDWTPGAAAFAALLAPATALASPAQPYPFCLAQTFDPASVEAAAGDYLAEWKWDGIRGQLIRRAGQAWLWSRGEERLDGRFPEVEAAAAALPDGSVLDGELLAWKDGAVMPFAALQTRIGRRQPGRKILDDAPVIFMAYDLLEWQGEDWRPRPLAERRTALERIARDHGLPVSPRLEATGWEPLRAERERARERGVEGLMLKRLDAPYVAGRRTGVWWKWKLDARSFDGVLVYAQAGHGRRSNLYTDYTLAVWDGPALVPVAKAYSGLTDAELLAMDRWIRAHTIEKFGPVRRVEPLQVFEIAFEAIQESRRHKAGLALRFPRIARWRQDKPAAEADTLASLRALLAPARG